MSISPPSRPIYAPYAEAGPGFHIGLKLLDPTHWMEPDHQAEAQFANKAKLLSARHGDVVATALGSEPAQRELLSLLTAYLLRQFPDQYRREGRIIHISPLGITVDVEDEALQPIDRAGRLVQEDLCLLEAGQGSYSLTAASLCAPSAWRLADKIGRPLIEIHAPVPGYADPMGKRVDRVFAHMKVDQPVWRANWSVMSEPTLFLDGSHDRSPARLVGLIPQTAGDRVFLRVERQTLRRLPETGAVVFTIKTHIDPLSSISGSPDLVDGLHRAVTGMPQDMAAYKAMEPIREALVGWLERKQRGI